MSRRMQRKRWTDSVRPHFLFLMTLVFFSGGWPGYAATGIRVEVLPGVARQGEVCVVRASAPMSIRSVHGEFLGENFPMAFEVEKGTYVGLLGIDRDIRPARYEIKVVATDGMKKFHSSPFFLEVKKVDFGTQILSLPASMVDLDLKTLERVEKERERLKVLFEGIRDERLWSGPFLSPVQGEVSTVFGINRVINDRPRGPHTGVDLRAEKGTPVAACNSGAVVLVDELFFSGKSVILDHGAGIYSMYFHLSEVLVHEGERISKGAVLGCVGSTGRSTGPHLHWGIRMNGARVDPLSLFRLTERLRE